MGADPGAAERPAAHASGPWCLPPTRGSARPRPCSTPMCRGRGGPAAGQPRSRLSSTRLAGAPPVPLPGPGVHPGGGRAAPGARRSPALGHRYRSRLYQVLRPATPIIPRARTLEASPAPATPKPLTPIQRTSERPSPLADDPGAQG